MFLRVKKACPKKFKKPLLINLADFFPLIASHLLDVLANEWNKLKIFRMFLMKQKIKEGMFTKYGERKKLRFEGD